MELELVVARYDEDLAWLRRVPGPFRVTVYDKGAGDLPNVGREAHTYLHHVVTRYDDLADLTVFAQGDPFDHEPRFHKVLRKLAADPAAGGAFRWFGFIVDEEDRDGRLFRTWSKNEDGRGLDLPGFWRAFWDAPVPGRFLFFNGAQFAVTRDVVRSVPLAFYRHALGLSASFPDAAHCFERCWDRVFGVEGVPADLREGPFPRYLRAIRSKGVTWEDVPEAYRDWCS